MSLFKWHKGEHNEWFNKIKRFNEKIKRSLNKDYKHDLPNTINYKTELNKILSDKNYTREEFNRQMKFIDNFLSKNALDIKKGTRGAKIPIWEFKEVKAKTREINKKRMIQKHRLEEEEATDRGVGMGIKVKDKPDLATNKIREKSFNWKRMSTTDFEKFKETLWEFDESIENMEKQMYDNYLKAIENEMGVGSIESKVLHELVKDLPMEVVIKKIYNDLNLGFKFVYSKSDFDIRFKTLRKAWVKINKDYQKNMK